MKNKQQNQTAQSGNVIFFVLLAVVLIGLVTAAVRSGGDGANIDKENILLKATQVRQYAAELERGVGFIMQNGASESDLRFAHANATSDYGDISTSSETQVFHRDGGAAEYRTAPTGINDGSQWEFYATSHLPRVGTSAADLVAVLPNVTEDFCDRINKMNGQDSAQPLDDATGGCINGGSSARFATGNTYSGSPNTLDEDSFTSLPATQACVECSDNSLHFYNVLLAR